MIILLHPRATRPKNRGFPLSILHIAAVIEGKEQYAIVDGNLDSNPGDALDRIMRDTPADLLAVSVMPGPQTAAAIPLCREFRKKYPRVPIIWGGYFPSVYPDAALNAPYVDYLVRGQGEDTFLELIEALKQKPVSYPALSRIKGLSYKDQFGLHVHNSERPLRSPGDYPWPPYHSLGNVEKYIRPTFLGSRTIVHQSSIGCPFRCKFCGVVPFANGREKMEPPERTAAILGDLKEKYAINAVQFYDNNFFLREDHTLELARRLAPLKLRWWTEGRIDAVLRYSDETWRALRESGSTMIFFGAESGSEWVLKQMNKQITPDQILELAARIRQFDIVPEFAFILGNPQEPDRETRETIAFIRKVKAINPDAEIIVQHYIPTPHPDGMYGQVEDKIQFPQTPEEWTSDRWYKFTTRVDPLLPWLPRHIKRRIDGFEMVVNSRWPTIQDIYLPRWGRALLTSLSSWRYAFGVYGYPFELEWAQKLVKLRKARLESI